MTAARQSLEWQERALFAETLQDIILKRSQSRRTWLVVPEDPLRGDSATRLSFQDVYVESARVASALRRLGAEPQRVAAIVANNSPEFIYLFFGAILAGLVPAPVHLPFFVARWDEYVQRLGGLLRDAQAQFLLCSDEYGSLAQSIDDPECRSACVGELVEGEPDAPLTASASGQASSATALIQYSSGSTRNPAGVQLTHSNVLWNVEGIGRAVGADPDFDVALSWLPLFHDMGLTGTMLYSWYWGLPLVLMSPQDFIARPASWLWAVSRFKVTGCAAPNFAYALCTVKSKVPDAQLEGLDLSTWRVAFNGAELVQEATVSAFTRRFAPYGFMPEAMYPVYGLAENVVACCFPPYGRPPVFDRVDRRALENGRAEPAADGQGEARTVVSVGTPIAGGLMRVIGDAGEMLQERSVGRVEIKSPCVMKGYQGREAATESVLTSDGWLRTGDLGYLAGGELHLVGRMKDVVKKAGMKYDAADIQSLVSEVPGVRAGCVAAFSLENQARGVEELAIVAETKLSLPAELQALEHAVRSSVSRTFGTRVDILRFVAPGELEKTSSGKVRTQECRRKYLLGTMRTL